MGYRVVYGPMPPVMKQNGGSTQRIRMLTALCLLLLALTVRQAWPEGTRLLQKALMPGEPTVTEAAFQDMLGEIRRGEPVSEAFTAFCRLIVEHGVQESY